MSKKEVAIAASTTVGPVIDYGDYAGSGFENQSSADIAVPFLAVLQSQSPLVQENPDSEVYRAGRIFDSVAETAVKDLLFVAAKTEHLIVEWKPREAGGGIVQKYTTAEAPAGEKRTLPNGSVKSFNPATGNELIETFYLYGVVVDAEQPLGMAIIPFTGAKIKQYKKANTRMSTFLMTVPGGRRINPPLFAHLIKVSTFLDKNPKGSFYNIDLTPANGDIASSLLVPSDPRFQAAAECKKLVDGGQIKGKESEKADAQGARDPSIPF